jgi:hypothetical protein
MQGWDLDHFFGGIVFGAALLAMIESTHLPNGWPKSPIRIACVAILVGFVNPTCGFEPPSP